MDEQTTITPYTVGRDLTGLVAGYGTSVIAGLAVGKIVQDYEMPFYQKASVVVGGFFLGSLVGTTVSKHTKNRIDEYADIVREVVRQVSEATND